jgi:hypothetical protein
VPLAAVGVSVEGIDASEAMIARLREKPRDRRPFDASSQRHVSVHRVI